MTVERGTRPLLLSRRRAIAANSRCAFGNRQCGIAGGSTSSASMRRPQGSDVDSMPRGLDRVPSCLTAMFRRRPRYPYAPGPEALRHCLTTVLPRVLLERNYSENHNDACRKQRPASPAPTTGPCQDFPGARGNCCLQVVARKAPYVRQRTEPALEPAQNERPLHPDKGSNDSRNRISLTDPHSRRGHVGRRIGRWLSARRGRQSGTVGRQ